MDDKLSQTCIQLSNNFRLIKTASVYLSAKITVPLTIGFIKPIIVFPVALINQLSAEQTEAILLHELAHIKRNDYLLNLLLCVVQAFLFFNPAVWLMQRKINKYREQSCDDLVLDQTQNQLAYAHALLLIEQHRSQSLNLILASNGKKYTLLNRIKRITDIRTNETSPKSKLGILFFTLITVGVCIACNHTEKKAAKPYKSKRLSFTVYNTKSTGFNPARPYAEWSTDTTKFIRKSEHDSFKVYTNKITYQPNKKYSKRYVFSGNNMILNGFSDTPIHSKTKYKVTVEDSTGNKKEYNSFDELPEADRKEFMKENKKPDKLLNVSISLKFPDSTKYSYSSKYVDSLELRRTIKGLAALARQHIADHKQQISSSNLNEHEKNRKRLVDSARKNWRNTTNYQPLPATTPITIKPE